MILAFIMQPIFNMTESKGAIENCQAMCNDKQAVSRANKRYLKLTQVSEFGITDTNKANSVMSTTFLD